MVEEGKGSLSWPVFAPWEQWDFQSFHFGCAYRQGVNGWEGKTKENANSICSFICSSFIHVTFNFCI